MSSCSSSGGNAFLFDDAALAASTERGALVLGCRLQPDGRRFNKARYVTLDELDLSSPRAVFLKDCRSKVLTAYCEAGRAKWMPDLRERLKARGEPVDRTHRGPAWDSARMFVPKLSGWKGGEHAAGRFGAAERCIELVAILFSIAKAARAGSDELFTSRHRGKARCWQCSTPGCLAGTTWHMPT